MADAAKTKKASSFLSSLKSGAPLGGGLGGLGAKTAGGGLPPEAMEPLKRRIDELEKKLADLAKGAPEEGEPPRPPSELMMFIHTKMELLERKLEEAQAESMRSAVLLREREEAQRRAQREVEDLFHSMREQQRAAVYDAALRDKVSQAAEKAKELEARLREAELKMIPCEEVLAALRDAEARERLETHIQQRLESLRSLAEQETKPEPPPNPPLKPGSLAPEPEPASFGPVGAPAEKEPMAVGDSKGTLLLLGRISDLERQLEELRKDRDAERDKRLDWERQVLETVSKEPKRFRKTGGAELAVEAAIETMGLALKERDATQQELSDALDLAQSQPPGSGPDPALRARISAAQNRMQELQQTLAQQVAMIQAWIKRNQEEKGS